MRNKFIFQNKKIGWLTTILQVYVVSGLMEDSWIFISASELSRL